MSTHSYLPLAGQNPTDDLWGLGHWLPQRVQVTTAIQMRIDEVIGATGDESENETAPSTTSMRQGIGLVFASGLAAGGLPFLLNWFTGARFGTALPLARLVQSMEQLVANWRTLPVPLEIWGETARIIGDLEPRAPGWLAAFFSALGEWVNWPLSWLTCWLVYGLAILVVAKFFGASTTLPRFYAATSYAFVPLLLTALSPIPCLGALATFIAVLWSFVIYVHATEVVTDLSSGKAVLSVVTPAAIIFLLVVLSIGAMVLSVFR